MFTKAKQVAEVLYVPVCLPKLSKLLRFFRCQSVKTKAKQVAEVL